MAEKEKGKEPEQRIVITYVSEEVDYQEDLLGKLMTLDHLYGMLGRGEEDQVFVYHVKDMKSLFQQRYANFMNLKKQGVPFPESMGFMPEPESEQKEGSGDNPDSG